MAEGNASNYAGWAMDIDPAGQRVTRLKGLPAGFPPAMAGLTAESRAEAVPLRVQALLGELSAVQGLVPAYSGTWYALGRARKEVEEAGQRWTQEGP
jgi:hypothetical protein